MRSPRFGSSYEQRNAAAVVLWPLVWATAAALILLVGCRSADTGLNGSSTAPAVRPVANPAQRGSDRQVGGDPLCGDLRRRFAALIDERDNGRCRTDSECACYPAVSNCGGASDRATVARLTTLARMYRLSGCPAPGGCAQQRCAPACVQRRCVSSAVAAVVDLPR